MRRRYEFIDSPKQLAAAWARLFTPDYLAAVSDASPHAIAVVMGYAMLGDGLIYFSDSGALTCRGALEIATAALR